MAAIRGFLERDRPVARHHSKVIDLLRAGMTARTICLGCWASWEEGEEPPPRCGEPAPVALDVVERARSEGYYAGFAKGRISGHREAIAAVEKALEGHP